VAVRLSSSLPDSTRATARVTLLGLSPEQVAKLNDDRDGRAVDKLFACDQPSLVLALVAHTVREFVVALDELHNDGTSVSFLHFRRSL